MKFDESTQANEHRRRIQINLNMAFRVTKGDYAHLGTELTPTLANQPTSEPYFESQLKRDGW